MHLYNLWCWEVCSMQIIISKIPCCLSFWLKEKVMVLNVACTIYLFIVIDPSLPGCYIVQWHVPCIFVSPPSMIFCHIYSNLPASFLNDLGRVIWIVEQFGRYTHFDSFWYRFWTIIPILLCSNNMYCLCRMKLNKQNEKRLTLSLHIYVFGLQYFSCMCVWLNCAISIVCGCLCVHLFPSLLPHQNI